MNKEITQNENKRDRRGTNPNSLKNLRPNKNGRPRKELSITQALRDYMNEVPTITIGGQKNTDKTWAQLVALGMLLKSVKGDASMAREILDRLEGRVPQTTELTGADGGAVKYEINVTDSDTKDRLGKLVGGSVLSNVSLQ